MPIKSALIWGVAVGLKRFVAVCLGAASYSVLSLGHLNEALAQSSSLPPVTVDAPTPRVSSRVAPSRQTARPQATARRVANPSQQQAAVPSIGVGPRIERGTGPVVGFAASQSVAGTKTDTPLLLTPSSISVVTRDEISARGAFSTLTEALQYTPGVSLGNYGSNTPLMLPKFEVSSRRYTSTVSERLARQTLTSRCGSIHMA